MRWEQQDTHLLSFFCMFLLHSLLFVELLPAMSSTPTPTMRLFHLPRKADIILLTLLSSEIMAAADRTNLGLARSCLV